VKSLSDDTIEAVSLKVSGVDFSIAGTCEVRNGEAVRLTPAFGLAGTCGVFGLEAASLAVAFGLAGTSGDRGLSANPLTLAFGLFGSCGVTGLELDGVDGLLPLQPLSPSPAFASDPASLRFSTGNFFVFLPSPKYSFSISAPDGRRSSRSGVLEKSPRKARASPGVRGVLLVMSSMPGAKPGVGA